MTKIYKMTPITWDDEDLERLPDCVHAVSVEIAGSILIYRRIGDSRNWKLVAH